MDDKELNAGNDCREQNRHCLAVLAARLIDGNKRAVADHPSALNRNGDGGTVAEGHIAAHALGPSWSVIVMVGGTLTTRGRTM